MDSLHFVSLVQKINAATLGSSGADISDLFHDDVIFVSPDFKSRLIRKEACLKSYEEFRSNVELTDYNLDDTQVDLVGNTAVVTYAFRVRYVMGGKSNDDLGRDLLVFQHAPDGRWLAVWRGMMELPKEPTTNT